MQLFAVLICMSLMLAGVIPESFGFGLMIGMAIAYVWSM